jgi:phosphoglycerate dehydrogenase-like enzyme
MGSTDIGGAGDEGKALVILAPAPQKRDRIFSSDSLDRLRQTFDVVDLEENPHLAIEEYLPRAFAVVGQPELDATALNAAKNLRAILNVEGNFFPNVDYATAFRNGVRVLGCGPAYSQAVAEFSLGMALDLARGISREDRAMRAGDEKYVSSSSADAILLKGAEIGILGFGNLGRALKPLLEPFATTVRVYDPWLPDSVLREAGVTPASLEETLESSTILFVFATTTAESEHLLNAARLDSMKPDARIVLASRAAVVDYDALLERMQDGKFFVGIDVWPSEPLDPESPFRELPNAVLSPHRAGGIPEAFRQIGEMVVDDLELLVRGLAPVRMQAAAPELVTRYRNRPVA